MKISYNEGCTLHNSTLEQDIELAGRAGFSHIELRLDKLREYLQVHTLADLKTLLVESQILPHAMNGIYTYTDFLSDRDDPVRQRALLEDIRFLCEVCNAIGSRDIIIVPPIYMEAENRSYTDPWEKRLADNVRIFTKLSDFVAPFHVRLALEIVGAPRSSVRTIAEYNEIARQVHRSNVGCTLDAFNLYLHSKSNDFSAIRTMAPEQIFVVHINGGEDGALEELQQSYRTFCDRGVMDVGNYLENLHAVGYDGPVSIEFFREDCWKLDAWDVICEAYETTKAVLAANSMIS